MDNKSEVLPKSSSSLHLVADENGPQRLPQAVAIPPALSSYLDAALLGGDNDGNQPLILKPKSGVTLYRLPFCRRWYYSQDGGPFPATPTFLEFTILKLFPMTLPDNLVAFTSKADYYHQKELQFEALNLEVNPEFAGYEWYFMGDTFLLPKQYQQRLRRRPPLGSDEVLEPLHRRKSEMMTNNDKKVMRAYSV